MTIVADTGIWVTANFKETQLADMQVGQPVDVKIDAYGGRTVKGEVESLCAATGAQVRAAAARQRHRQLHEGRAARAGAHRSHEGPRPHDRPLRPGMSAVVTCRSTQVGATPAQCADHPRAARRSTIAGRLRVTRNRVPHRDRGDAGGGARADRHVASSTSRSPHMMGNLGATLDEIAWVSTGYIIANVIVIPMSGWLSGVLRPRALSHGLDRALRHRVVLLRRRAARSGASSSGA